MKIALAQINTTVADVRGNLEKILGAAARAEKRGAELVVFPEQSLAGYPALDLWEEPAFLKANVAAVKALARRVKETAVVVGFVWPNASKKGKPVHNAAALLHRGRIVAVRAKTLLPTYDVFDEARYFEPADSNAPIRFRGRFRQERRLGLSVCEDAWGALYQRLYARDPIEAQVKAGADVLVNISASPFIRGKSALRVKLLAAHARRARRPLLYCNQVGGNDELIFDGQSLAFDARGRLAARAKAFEEDLLIVDTEAPAGALSPEVPPPLGDIEEVEKALTLGLRDYLRKCGFAKAIVGLSGGIDSAVVAALAARALGPANVTGVSMPGAYSSPGSVADAEALAKNLGIRLLSAPIGAVFQAYRESLKALSPGPAEDVAEQNIQARIRGNLLMALANREGGLLLTTGNKSELSVGYCTLYGDMSGGLSVLADVPKTTVYELARWINRDGAVIPQASIDKPPSAELKPDQLDQDDLPPYATLDAILTAYVEDHLEADQIAARGHPRPLALQIMDRIDRAEFKRRQAAPSLKISPKAYGVGRRMPIARGRYR